MSHNDSTPDRSSKGPGGSSSHGKDAPEYGQRIEGAPPGPSYDAPGPGQGEAGEQYSAPRYGQGQYGQYGPGHYQQGQYGQDEYGQGQYGQGQYGQAQYGQGQYGQGHYPQDQYGQDQYGQNQYGQGPHQQGPYGQAPYGHGHYDMGPYGAPPKPAGSGLGIAALVLGILALLTSWVLGLGFVPGVVGLVLGIVAVRKLGRVAGASKAVPVIGIVLSVLGILASIMFFFMLMTFLGGVLEGPCSQYLNDPAAFEQCLAEQMGMEAVPQ